MSGNSSCVDIAHTEGAPIVFSLQSPPCVNLACSLRSHCSHFQNATILIFFKSQTNQQFKCTSIFFAKKVTFFPEPNDDALKKIFLARRDDIVKM